LAHFFDKAESYFKKNYELYPGKLTESVTVHIGSSEYVSFICGPSAWSCNVNHRLVIRDDGDSCQMILHELGHTASTFIFGSWDSNHDLLTDYYSSFVLESCK